MIGCRRQMFDSNLDRNFSNSALVKHVPLSVIIVSGRPNCANRVLSSSITAVDVADAVLKASYPLGVHINENQVHFSLNWTCVIEM